MTNVQAELSKVPVVLDKLVAEGSLSAQDQKEVLAHIQQHGAQGKFFGQVAVEMGKVSAEAVQASMRDQSLRMARAAVTDMESVIKGDILLVPTTMTPHWGNADVSGQIQVNAVPPTVTSDLAAASAANIGKMIVLLAASQTPQMAAPLQDGVIASKMLAEAILSGDSPLHPLDKAGQWIEMAKAALAAAAQGQFSQTTLDAYIDNRFAEVTQGVALAQSVGKGIDGQVR